MRESRPGLQGNAVQFARELAPTIGKAIPVGLGLGLVSVAGITWRSHRELTHRSIELTPFLQKLIDTEQTSMGMDNTIRASVHRIHHRFPDATIHPFYRIARAVQWAQQNQDLAGDLEIPAEFKGLDPYVDSFSLSEVMEIGQHGIDEVKARLGEEYEDPVFFTREELREIFYSGEARYHYPDTKRALGDYSQDEMARILLTDPHSPSLQRPVNGKLNGVRREMHRNIPDYQTTAQLFKTHPEIKPEDLQT